MKKYFVLFYLMLLPYSVFGQQDTTADELFQKARTEAFDRKDYPAAIATAKEALVQAPDYTDISVFLGRLYTWSGDTAKARQVFTGLHQKKVEDADFFLAYASLEYWNDQNAKALELADEGLNYNPRSADLLLLKAKIYQSLKDYEASQVILKKLLADDPKNSEARALLLKLDDLTAKNAVGITYNFTHFDKQFADDWHLIGLSYKRSTSIGSFIVRANYANKFGSGGTQLELEAYPRLSDMFYLYVAAGFSGDVGIFPKYRTGLSLNANLPKSYEAEIGVRQLYFADNIVLYTAAVGKYYKNYWFNLRAYITPDGSEISQSYTGTVRYYTKGADDYFSVTAGTGISPEDYRSNLLDDQNYKLTTYKFGFGYNFTVNTANLFSVSAMYFNQEYLKGKIGNQYDFNIGYTRKF
ncbi:YaiO family outer membrane beta-barrel protein [Kaistella palustris]|uniref:YaiO family outer membrane beta-barrel protein n=1 Tax=Kaistella palustris TaxID=493376 RepID=UPI000413B565|nr:YaiO family outer membrane beta-barrel protein [Kaistella palustris]